MNSREAIKTSIQTADMVCSAYLGDLTDEELMKRPHAQCNHLNWQVGHLIASDHQMFSGCYPDGMPALPEGFKEKYSKETTGNDDPGAFCKKEELMKIHESQRAVVMAKLDEIQDSDLDTASSEELQGYAPTHGAALNMLGAHWLMHAGQWVIVRRDLGREIVM